MARGWPFRVTLYVMPNFPPEKLEPMRTPCSCRKSQMFFPSNLKREFLDSTSVLPLVSLSEVRVSGGILNIQSDDYLAEIVLDTLDDRDHPDSQGKVSGNPLPERPPF